MQQVQRGWSSRLLGPGMSSPLVNGDPGTGIVTYL